MKNKALSLTLTMLMLCAMVTTALAAPIATCWDNIARCGADLTFSGTTANCTASIVGKSGTTKINAQMFLQERKSSGRYATVKHWPLQTTTGSSLNLSEKQTGCTSGTYYRVGVITNVFNSDGTSESITVYSSSAKCP